MAKMKTTEQQAVTAAEAPAATQALATTSQSTSVMAIASNAKAHDNRGTENIDSSDVRLPFIAIAQKTSKAIDPTEGKYIEGLKFLDMYNSETREIYGQGPIHFIPINLRKRAHLLKENGTLGEPVAWDDPRVTWDGAREAGNEKPEGQRIYDWAVLLLPSMELVVLSFRSTSFGAGKSLNGFVRMRKPSFAGRYALSVTLDKNEKGSFGKFQVQPAGKPTDDQFEYAESVYETIKDQKITTTEDDVEEPGSHDGPVEGEVVQLASQPARSNDKMPF
jgi:hypothetical protein